MRNRYSLMISAVLFATLALGTAGAYAAIVNPVVDFGVSYAKEGTRVAGDHTSTVGDMLTIVGKVVDFNDPFADLNPNAAGIEYTYIMTGMVSQGTLPPNPQYVTNYTGGTFRIYEDNTPDADFANQATFTDGTMILEGAFAGFRTTTISTTGSQNSDFQFTGGTLFNRVSQGGVGFLGIDTGSFSVHTMFVPLAQRNQGYFGMSDTKLDVQPPVATEPTTWGRIKSQY